MNMNMNMNTNINITCTLYHKDMWYSVQVKKGRIHYQLTLFSR